jgi:hypothetical protein
MIMTFRPPVPFLGSPIGFGEPVFLPGGLPPFRNFRREPSVWDCTQQVPKKADSRVKM